jgi:hypothetical protein
MGNQGKEEFKEKQIKEDELRGKKVEMLMRSKSKVLGYTCFS